jgi:hypothetical protein
VLEIVVDMSVWEEDPSICMRFSLSICCIFFSGCNDLVIAVDHYLGRQKKVAGTAAATAQCHCLESK